MQEGLVQMAATLQTDSMIHKPIFMLTTKLLTSSLKYFSRESLKLISLTVLSTTTLRTVLFE